MALSSCHHLPATFWSQVFREVHSQQCETPLLAGNSVDPSLFPWFPARVFHQWRSICLSIQHRELWSNVRVIEPFSGRLWMSLKCRLEVQMQYAGDAPISITLNVDTGELQKICVDALWPHRANWRRFTVASESSITIWDTTFQDYITIAANSIRPAFPALTSVSLTSNPKARVTRTENSSPTPNALDLFRSDRTPLLTEARLHYSLSPSSMAYVDAFGWE